MRHIALPCSLALAMLPLLASAQSAAPEPTVRGGEPVVERLVSEDDLNKVEVLRVRGQTKRVTVTPKIPGLQPYEVVPPDATGRASDGIAAPGKRVWWSMQF